MQLVRIAPEVVQLLQRVLEILPPAALHGPQSRDRVAQRAVLKGGERLHTEPHQVPAAVRLPCPTAGAVDPDRLEQVFAEFAGESAGRLAAAVGRVAILQPDANRFVLAADADQYAV